MAKDTKACEVSLSSKEVVSSLALTLEIPNFFTVPDEEFFSVTSSPTFKFAGATWYFDFLEGGEIQIEKRQSFDVCLVRLDSEFPAHAIIYSIAILDAHGEKYDSKSDARFFDDVEDTCLLKEFVNEDPSSDRRDSLTLIIHLTSDKTLGMDLEQVLFRVQGDTETLSQDFKKLFLNGKKHDLTLRVAGKEFRVHQDILMARCKVFEAMLTHDMVEKEKGVIDIPDCDPQAMKQFLLYVYSGKVETLSPENALKLYYAADKYQMMSLKEACTEFIMESLSPSIVCDVVQLALNHSDTDLLKFATAYFEDNISQILPTVGWMSFMKSNTIAANELLIKATKKCDCTKS